jgi:hypothetical protein
VHCAPGQTCFDLSQLGGPASQVCTCVPAYSDTSTSQQHTDTCADYGLVCAMDLSDVQASTCRMPLEFEECKASPGCGTPSDCPSVDGGASTCRLDCVTLPEATGSVNYCLRPCKNKQGMSDSSMCAESFTTCYPSAPLTNHCFFNWCADPGCGAVSPTCDGEAGERAMYFKPCTANKANDGTCLQVVFSDGSEGGFCFQGGTSVGPCDPAAMRSTAAYAEMCPVGQWCRAIELDPIDPSGKKELGLCTTLCNAAPSTTANPALDCADTTTGCVACMDYGACAGNESVFGPPASPDSDTASKSLMGYCLTRCDPLGTAPCGDDSLPAPNTLHLGCVTDSSSDTGYCSELSPSASAVGSSCPAEIMDVDLRSHCADRLLCLDTCVGYCDTQTCPSPTSICPSCQPAGDACKSLGAGTVGYCDAP